MERQLIQKLKAVKSIYPDSFILYEVVNLHIYQGNGFMFFVINENDPIDTVERFKDTFYAYINGDNLTTSLITEIVYYETEKKIDVRYLLNLYYNPHQDYLKFKESFVYEDETYSIYELFTRDFDEYESDRRALKRMIDKIPFKK